MNRLPPLRVTLGIFFASRCPLCPSKRTCAVQTGMSALGCPEALGIRPGVCRFGSAANQRTPALIQRSERIRGRNRGAQLIVVPRILRFLGLLYLEEIHVVDLAPIGTDHAGAE